MDKIAALFVEKSPYLAALLAIVFAFLWFLFKFGSLFLKREAEREQREAARAEACHRTHREIAGQVAQVVEQNSRHLERNTVVLERVEERLDQPQRG